MDGNLPLGCTSDATLNSPCVSGTSNRTETIRTWMARVCRGVSGSLAINGSCSLGSSGGHPSRHFFWRSHLPSRFQTPILFPKLNCMSLVLPALFCSVFSMPAPLSRSWHLDTRLVDPCWSFDPSTVAQLHLRYRGSWIVWVTALQHQGLAMSTAYFQRFATAEASRHVCMMYRNHRLRVGGLRCRWPIGFLGKAKIHTKRF